MKALKLFSLLAVAAIALGFSSCNDEESGGSYQAMFFANYLGTDGSITQFQYSEPNSLDVINLKVKGVPDLTAEDNVAVGERLIVALTFPYGETIDPDKVYEFAGAARLNWFGRAELGAAPENFMDTDEFYLNTIVVNGRYLDISGLADTAARNKLSLILDRTTTGMERPQLYLLYEEDSNPFAGTSYFASFDISEVLALTSAKGFRVNVRNSNGNQYTYDFDMPKSGASGRK